MGYFIKKMATSFELFLLDQSQGNDVIALARRGADTAIEHIPIDTSLKRLAEFGRGLGDVLTGNAQRPNVSDMMQFGNDLFEFLFRGSLRAMYDRLPCGPVSLQILSNRPEIKEVPWEYVVTPDRRPSPHRDRSIIRVPLTCGIDGSGPRKFGKKVQVLFVSADPVDQAGVDWSEVKAVIQRAMDAHMPCEASVKVIEGATRESLIKTIARESFDVFHFYGHGDLRGALGNWCYRISGLVRAIFFLRLIWLWRWLARVSNLRS
ncbi:hypothetical protein [Pseudogulbenkiania sp. NH8B]|uniref:hypothetical protein n=1 Tax=Pseudogulbenkiania sp. (strain NH8B) TaxID=748280 RepID=UPI0011D1C164|nr:hypothetical protein [Pseudogulbenkiania sp. NH8B]